MSVSMESRLTRESLVVRTAILQQGLSDPEKFFGSPYALENDKRFSKSQKIFLLRSWAWDMQELLVAEDENMTGKDETAADRLKEIQCVLGRLS